MKIQTAERVSGDLPSDNYVLKRSIIAYYKAAEMISGRALEIGTGSQYGLEIVTPSVDKLVTIDKFKMDMNLSPEMKEKVEFKQMTVPPFAGLEDNSFDFAFTFQVIEHIEDDHRFVDEIYRVLKPGGKLLVTTPNRTMSITRNPWHVREYIPKELNQLLYRKFKNVEQLGVFGNEKVMKHYQENVESVKRITRFDIFNLQYRLPRRLLQVPYDILNRVNRNRLYNKEDALVKSIELEDFSLKPANDECLDLFYIAEK